MGELKMKRIVKDRDLHHYKIKKTKLLQDI